MYNGSDLAGPYIGIRENHTGQIDSYNGIDLAKFVQIDLAHQVAPLFVILIVDLMFSKLATRIYILFGRSSTTKASNISTTTTWEMHRPTKHTQQSPPTTNPTHINLTMRTMVVAQLSTHRGCQERASTWPCRRHRRPTGGSSPRSEEGSTAGRLRGGRGIAVAVAAAPSTDKPHTLGR